MANYNGGYMENIKAPLLFLKFDEILNQPAVPPKETSDFSSIFLSQSDYSETFKEAHNTFCYVYNQKHLYSKDSSQELFNNFKRIRRFGIICKAVFNIFDARHCSPQGFHELLSFIGKANDFYFNHGSLYDGKGKCFDLVNELLYAMRSFTPDSLSFNPATIENVQDYSENLLAKIEFAFQTQYLPTESFHDLRKAIRFFADILQVSATKNMGKHPHWLCQSLLKLSIKFGETHDQLLKSTIGNEDAYKKAIIPVESKTAEQFLKLKPYIQRSLLLDIRK